MYDVIVPVLNRKIERMGKENILREMKRGGVNRMLLATGEFAYDAEKRSKIMKDLERNCKYFKENGMEVYTWNWTFFANGKPPFTKMEHYDGIPRGNFYCPSDKDFVDFVKEYVKDLARTGVDMILFDDDFRISFYCKCENHMKLMAEELGEELTPDELKLKILSGGKNKYRDAFRKINRELLINFAKEIRKAVDEVNPNVRIGICAVFFMWYSDGVTPAEISKILAGNTKPYMRLIGAPYWAAEHSWNNHYLEDTFELIRMERSFCDDSIEIVAEGDCFPRPRYTTPASYLELYDIAMRAEGTLDGIMKYTFDYHSKPGYEPGYVDAHCKNRELYKQVEAAFAHKAPLGVRVYENENKFETITIPKDKEGDPGIVMNFFPMSSRVLSNNSIPTTYYGEGVCGIAFGENIKCVPREAFKRGMIIDIEAARLLKESGTDVGIEEIGESVLSYEEYFEKAEDYARSGYNAYLTVLNPKAEVDSRICYTDESGNTAMAPAAYYYENKDGEKFFVFTFDGSFAGNSSYRSYARSAQTEAAIRKLSGKKLPAYSYGNPDLYIMCKEKDGAMAVGLWNCFADGIDKPIIQLNKNYSEIKFINCTGELTGDTVTLSGMTPFSFAGFEVKI